MNFQTVIGLKGVVKYLVILILIQISVVALGQQGMQDSDLLNKNAWSIVASPFIFNKPTFTENIGPVSKPKASYSFGFNVGIHHTHSFNKKWSLTTGLEYGKAPLKVVINLDGAQYESVLDGHSYSDNYSEYGINHWTIPLLINRDIYRAKNATVHVFGGIGISYRFISGQYSFSIRWDTASIPVFQDIFMLNERKQLQLNYIAGFGLNYKLKNHNSIFTDVIFNYGPEQIISKGRYAYFSTTPSYKTTGKIGLSGSYIGLRLGYSLTRHIKQKRTPKIEYEFERSLKKGKIRTLKSSELFSVNHFGAFGNYKVFNEAKLTTQIGSYKINTFKTPGFDLGFSYHWNINFNNSIISGLRLSFTHDNYNLHLSIDPPVLNSEIDLTTNKTLDAKSYSLMLLWEHRFRTKNDAFFYLLHGGLMIEKYTDFFIGEFEFDSIKYVFDPGTSNYLVELEQNPNGNFHFNPYIAFGISKILKSRNILSFNVNFNYATGVDREGFYELYRNSSKYSKGTYSWNASSIGIGLNYILIPKSKLLQRKSVE